MYGEKYVVLRAKQTRLPTFESIGTRGLPSATSMETDEVEVELEEVELSKNEATDLRRDPNTRAIAPHMPMKLIKPVDESDDTSEENDEVEETWGIKAVNASRSEFDGSGITVAVLDTGIDPEHPAFEGIELIQRNFTQGSDDDVNGHGTHCAGTIFGQDIDGKRIGVARNIKRALIGKVLGKGGGSSADIAQAILWAVNGGANVISMSLGIDFPGYVDLLVQQTASSPNN